MIGSIPYQVLALTDREILDAFPSVRIIEIPCEVNDSYAAWILQGASITLA